MMGSLEPVEALNLLPQVVGIIVILVAVYFGAVGRDRDADTSSERRNISCDSPNCVRCRSYVVRLSKVFKEEWQKYSEEQPVYIRHELARLSSTIENLGDVASPEFQPTFELAGLQTKPVHSATFFSADVKALELNYHNILHEYRRVATCDHGWVVNSTPTGEWKAYYFINQGQWVEKNVKSCTKTASVIDAMQNVMTDCVFGNACFSVVNPGTRIAEHFGPCNLRVRCHFGLEVPSGCELMVDNVKLHWKPGKCTLFDDSYLHSVTHTGPAKKSTPRAVLLIDLWNPEVTAAEKKALRHLLCTDRMTHYM